MLPFTIDAMVLRYLWTRSTSTHYLSRLRRLGTAASRRKGLSASTSFTVASLLCTAVMCCFWPRKALDVENHEHLYFKIPMATVLLEAGHSPEQPFVHTPTDFVARPGYFF
ncbi:hypothetical protein F5Y07DRAFT_395475 [Xylaria sp. FL0933]|nr:hypothetical protein F5Y07DRAFT_395475 [Xylaria sp. FL0933]